MRFCNLLFLLSVAVSLSTPLKAEDGKGVQDTKKTKAVEVLVFPPETEEQERHARDIMGDELYEKELKSHHFLSNMTEEEKRKIYEDHKKNVSSKYPEETPEIKKKRKTLIQSTYSKEVFSTTDPVSGRDPCEDRAITVDGEEGPLLGYDPNLDQLCKEIMQISFEEESKTSRPSFISLDIPGGYKFTYQDTQIDFNTITISKNNVSFVGLYIGNHSGFPLEKLSPENTTKEIKKDEKTIIEEWAEGELVRKQVQILTGNDFPAEMTAFTIGGLKKDELKEAFQMIDSFERELSGSSADKDSGE